MQNGNSKGLSNIIMFNEYSTKPQTQINSQVQANQLIDNATKKYIDSKFESINQYLPLLFQLSQGNLPDKVQLKVFNFLEMLFAKSKQNQSPNLDHRTYIKQNHTQVQEQPINAQALQLYPPETGNQNTKVQYDDYRIFQEEQPIVAAVVQQKPTQRKVAATPDQIQAMKQRQTNGLEGQNILLSQISQELIQSVKQLQQTQNIGVIQHKPNIVVISNGQKKSETMKPIHDTQLESSSSLKIERLSHCCICELSVQSTIRTKCNHLFCDSCFTNNIKQQLDRKVAYISCPYCSAKVSQQTLNLIGNVSIMKGLVNLINSNQLQKLKQINGISFIQCKSQYCSYFCIRSKQYDRHQSFCPLCLDFTVKN